ncbi:MAG TPA: plastocyanin/azurin family copper-binding protein [Longimicrobiales bacterium]|nr:plastocyanin/azurin family copper-binding protein [Longimicrobiales bacterium]
MEHSRSMRHVGLAALALLLAACGGGTEPDPQPGPQVLAAVSGSGQTAEISEAVPNPLVVSVTQDRGPVAGIMITWGVTAGGGSVDPTSFTTSAAGTASTTWTLGSSAGANTVQASATGVTGSPVTFNATATEPLPPAPTEASVEVDDNVFDPSTQRVAAGGTVTWTWVGNVAHNVTFSSGTNSITQSSGTFDRDFPAVGSFAYQCTIHAGMTGTITVE